MKQRSNEQGNENLKKLKVDYLKSINNNFTFSPLRKYFTEFETHCTVFDLCLHPTKHLIAIYGRVGSIFFPNCFHDCIQLFTIDGYLITKFALRKTYLTFRPSRLYISDNIIVREELEFHTIDRNIMLQNEYNFITQVPQNGRVSCFDCDEDNMYVCERNNGNNLICVYTHNFDLVKSFYSLIGCHIAMKVRQEYMYLLNCKDVKSLITNTPYSTTIAQICLSSGKCVKGYNISTLYNPIYLSFDPFGNVVIGNNSTDRLIIWYPENRIRFQKSPDNVTIDVYGLAVTDRGEVIRSVKSNGSIRIYESFYN